MFSKPFIASLKEKCSHLQCPDCGENHSVTFFAKGLLLSPQFEEGTCDGFKVLVNNLLKTELERFLKDPFPHLR